jgi:hypothetical protein
MGISAMPAPAVVAPRPATAPSSRIRNLQRSVKLGLPEQPLRKEGWKRSEDGRGQLFGGKAASCGMGLNSENRNPSREDTRGAGIEGGKTLSQLSLGR